MERPLQKIDKKTLSTQKLTMIPNWSLKLKNPSESFIGIALPRERPSGYTPQDLYSLKTSDDME